jgi:hypothetical protein
MAALRSLFAGCSAFLLAAFDGACTTKSFACAEDEQCKNGSMGGTCEPTGVCSFPDEDCESGRRYGAHAAGLSGQCVPLDAATTEGGPSSIGSTTPDDDGTTVSGGTLPLDDTTAGDPATSPTEGMSTGGPDATGSTTTGTRPCVSFEDDFERPDSVDIGNGWIEKTPNRFALVAGRVDDESGIGNYKDNLVYRPVDDSVLDVDVSIELRFVDASLPGYPQLHVRAQGDDIAAANTLHAYDVYIESDGVLAIAIVRIDSNGGSATGVQTELPEPLETGADYLLSARVEGTDPVVVEGTFERWNGNTWVLVAEAELIDGDPERITTPGTVAISGDAQTSTFTYDRFDMDERNCD